MNEKAPGVVFAVATAVMIIVAAYFFSITGITIEQFLTINTIPLLKEIITINFAAFLLSASFAMGFILAIGKKYLFKYAMVFALVGALIGIAGSLLLFPQLIDFFAPMAILLLAIPISLKNLSAREKELKYMAVLRSGAGATGRIVSIVCAGFFIYLLFFTLTNTQKYQDDFIPQLLSYTIGNGPILSDQFNESLAGAMSTQQQQTITQIQSLDSVKNLAAKGDPDGLALVSQLDATKTYVTSQSFKDQVIQSLKNQKVDLGEGILKQLPMLSLFAKYAWILYPIAALILTLFIGNLVVRNLGAGIYFLIRRIFSKRNETEGKAEQKK
ncbi:Uncharacterised protein [uncultured archaeon]|nr:Uncharacterised protein [uncultured archaeon]